MIHGPEVGHMYETITKRIDDLIADTEEQYQFLMNLKQSTMGELTSWYNTIIDSPVRKRK